MRRGRPPSRGDSPASPRRVGRPPKSESSVLSYGRSYYEGLRIPSGVIRSNFGRRGYGGRPFGSLGSRGIMRSRGRGRPSGSRSSVMNFNNAATNKSFNDYAARSEITNSVDDYSKDDQPSTSGLQNSSGTMNGFAARPGENPSNSKLALAPGHYEDVNLLGLIAGGTSRTGSPCTVKDLVSLANFRRLSTACQQHLLQMLPKRDRTIRADGTLEPTFSALKNEYLSAALLDFNERLYTGEVSPTGEIIAIPSSSAIPSTPRAPPIDQPSTSSCAPPPSSPSRSVRRGEVAPSPPPLPRIRINLASKIITFIPRDGERDGWTTSSGVLVTRRTLNGGEEGRSESGAISVNGTKSHATNAGSLTEVDLTPLFVAKAACNSSQSGESVRSNTPERSSRSPNDSLSIKKKKSALK